MKKNSFFSLTPERVKYDQFWIDIRQRNRWLIMLRYGAVVMLVSMCFGVYAVESFFPNIQFYELPLWIISAVILAYNLIFHKLWNDFPKMKFKKLKVHSLHFSLMQICFDFCALIFLIYFTGGVESPLNAFFIFHIIIGSLLLPGSVVGLILSIVILVLLSISLLSFYGTIPHHTIIGLLPETLYDNVSYIVIFYSFLTLTLFVCIYLTNSIAKQLYTRERLLTDAYQNLENAEKEKSQYVMSIVHDLKTPIAAALTYLNMILGGNLGAILEEQKKPLERSKTRLYSAITTINDILNISHIKLLSKLDELQDVSLCDLFREIFQDTSVLFKSKNIRIDLVCEQKGPFMLKSEPKLLKLALSNLISNAFKYTNQDGKVEVRILDNQNLLTIIIADSGIGIPKKDIDKIFKDFYRSSVSKKLAIEGTGLGLSIVNNIIKKFGGSARVESPSYLFKDEKNPGTQFIVDFVKN